MAIIQAVLLAARLFLPMLAVSVHDDERIAHRRLETVQRYDETHRVALTALALSGDPVKAILAEAQDDDLIDMGAFGEGRVRAWLLGSTTEAVLRAVSQPLLLHR